MIVQYSDSAPYIAANQTLKKQVTDLEATVVDKNAAIQGYIDHEAEIEHALSLI